VSLHASRQKHSGVHEAGGVCHQNAGAGLIECLESRVQLVRHQIHDTTVSEMYEFVVRNTPASVALQVQHSIVIGPACVWHEHGVRGIKDLDVLFQL